MALTGYVFAVTEPEIFFNDLISGRVPVRGVVPWPKCTIQAIYSSGLGFSGHLWSRYEASSISNGDGFFSLDPPPANVNNQGPLQYVSWRVVVDGVILYRTACVSLGIASQEPIEVILYQSQNMTVTVGALARALNAMPTETRINVKGPSEFQFLIGTTTPGRIEFNITIKPSRVQNLRVFFDLDTDSYDERSRDREFSAALGETAQAGIQEAGTRLKTAALYQIAALIGPDDEKSIGNLVETLDRKLVVYFGSVELLRPGYWWSCHHTEDATKILRASVCVGFPRFA